MCEECYSSDNRVTPLLNPLDCLEIHMQYICGTCGHCIYIEQDPNRVLQRWNFPFKSLEIAKLYLRTADYTMKKSCGIYEIKSKNGRVSYRIFADCEDLRVYLKKTKIKTAKRCLGLNLMMKLFLILIGVLKRRRFLWNVKNILIIM